VVTGGIVDYLVFGVPNVYISIIIIGISVVWVSVVVVVVVGGVRIDSNEWFPVAYFLGLGATIVVLFGVVVRLEFLHDGFLVFGGHGVV